MSTEVVDLTALDAALEAPALNVPDTSAVEAELTPKIETEAVPEVSSEETEKSEAKDDKSDDKAKVEAKVEPVNPKAVAEKIHKDLLDFYKEATPEGKERLQGINKAMNSLLGELKQAKAAQGDITELKESSKELEDLVRSADEQIYRGDPAIVSNIYDDVVSHNGNAESFEKLVPAFVDKLKATNPEKYYSDHVAPIYQHALESTGMVDAVRNLVHAYNNSDKAALRSGIEAIARHLEEVGGKVEGRKAETEAKQTEQSQAAYKTEIQDSCVLAGKKTLGASLKPILETTELGTYSKAALMPLATEVWSELNRRLAADKLFNSRMQRMFEAKNTEGIRSEYAKKVSSISNAVVRATVEKMYPGELLKPRSAAPKAAPAPKTVKTAAGNAVKVASKPKQLDRTVKGSDILEINGTGYTTLNGKRTLVTWR